MASSAVTQSLLPPSATYQSAAGAPIGAAQSPATVQKPAKSDQVSLSQNELALGAAGFGLTAVGIGAAGMYFMRDRNARANANIDLDQYSGKIRVPVKIDGRGIEEFIPLHSVTKDGFAFESPRAKNALPFHPAQLGPNCSVDALNMLHNGYGPLLMGTIDSTEIRKQLAVDKNPTRPVQEVRDSVTNNVTEPKDLPAINKLTFEKAEKYLSDRIQELEHRIDVSPKQALRDELHARKTEQAELRLIKGQQGRLEHLKVRAGAGEHAEKFAQFTGNRVIIAQPTPDLGTAQSNFKFTRHYFILEKDGDTWVKRDGTKKGVTPLMIGATADTNGRPVRNLQEAVTGLKEHQIMSADTAEKGSVREGHAFDRNYLNKSMHVFLPRGA